MNSKTGRAIFALGNTADPNCWSGIPYHFYSECQKQNFANIPGQIDLEIFQRSRLVWNFFRKLRGHPRGGYQYSEKFLDAVEQQIPPAILAQEIISFNQTFPRARTVQRAGGKISYYIDATLAALTSGRGLEMNLPKDIREQVLQLEQENYRLAERVIAMGTWTAESLVRECGVDPTKVHTVLPGANLDLPENWVPKAPSGRAGVDRPFVLGFVGKDWKRKGLPIVIEVRDRLAARGWKVQVQAAGEAPAELTQRDGVRFVGFIDKRTQADLFLRFLESCDVGCLFSAREALGISTLEFLRVGIPVAGYAIEGPADTLPEEAGFRFALTEGPLQIADRFEAYLQSEAKQHSKQTAAQHRSESVRWARCVREFKELWTR
ncbi:glycosyltransferase family 4 protein [Telmatocola sphagniphila]|uniref:Glycosyltransferase family 4 protein n=1 Tax=Telmatocola sphagniphila TaxID=1123043 RepID=A0A8E6B9T1_9BACT|nr:glycosyltransferase family 4 protein [Telmatocola sphagniphila]QVL33771.1 glycosyltransferase family 4 protein [Telmatocola sphagniphila]